MDELSEQLKRLEKACEQMELITELTKKYKDIKVVSDMLFNKDVEDGILAKLDDANLQQLKTMKNGYPFRFYTKDVTDNLIDQAILRNIRREKLKKLSK